MKLIIEVIKRSIQEADRVEPWFIAVVTEGETSHPAVGAGSNPRVATTNALGNFHNARDAATAPKTESLNLASDAELAPAVEGPTIRPGATRRVAISRNTIEKLLREAAERQLTVEIDGVRVDGSPYAARAVKPSKVEYRRVGFGHSEGYLICYDEGADDVRTFKVSGIARAEVVK